MRLPNAERAVVDVRKLREYCLNAEHPRGQHKARVFKSAVRWTAVCARLCRARRGWDGDSPKFVDPSFRRELPALHLVLCSVAGRIIMNKEICVLDVVALTEDISDRGLLRGQVGTVVEALGSGVFEVEFVDNDDRTYALLPLKSSQLLVLHYQPT
jgi:hypothetical protein